MNGTAKRNYRRLKLENFERRALLAVFPGASVGEPNVDHVISGSVSGVYDFSGDSVLIRNVVLDAFDGRTEPAPYTLESVGQVGDGKSSGEFRVIADSIMVEGSIDAVGKGYGGGGGGGGAATSYFFIKRGEGGVIRGSRLTEGSDAFEGPGTIASTSTGGNGGIGQGYGGQEGTPGKEEYAGFLATHVTSGGRGGRGGGVYGGDGGEANRNGRPGGYYGVGGNIDNTTGFELFLGSGGGGGGGGDAGTVLLNFYGNRGGSGGVQGGGSYHSFNDGAGGGGGGGGAGGGVIRLDASSSIDVLPGASLIADGTGHADLGGGFGAGGGIGLRAPNINLAPDAKLRTLGGFDDGNGSTTNGGTIKILHGGAFQGQTPTHGGRIVMETINFLLSILPQTSISDELQVHWTGGTAITELFVFENATGWNNLVRKEKVWGHAKEHSFQGLDSGTYYVAARSWQKLDDGSWSPSSVSNRVPHIVQGESIVPVLLPQGSITEELQVTWTGGTAVTELFVFAEPTGWSSFVRKEKAYGNAKEHVIDGLDDGTYYVSARSWYKQLDGTWESSAMSERMAYQLHTAQTTVPSLYLNFDGEQISNADLYAWAGTDWAKSISAYIDPEGDGVHVEPFFANHSNRPKILNRITELVQEDLEPYGIKVEIVQGGAVTDEGATTIFFGASSLTHPHVAADIDLNNDNQTDIAFVGPEDWGDVETTALAMADVALHEAGHTFGLYHVDTRIGNQIYPETMGWRYTAPQSQWARDTAFLDITFNEYPGHGPGPQNAHQTMLQNFGLSPKSNRSEEIQLTVEQLIHAMHVHFNATIQPEHALASTSVDVAIRESWTDDDVLARERLFGADVRNELSSLPKPFANYRNQAHVPLSDIARSIHTHRSNRPSNYLTSATDASLVRLFDAAIDHQWSV